MFHHIPSLNCISSQDIKSAVVYPTSFSHLQPALRSRRHCQIAQPMRLSILLRGFFLYRALRAFILSLLRSRQSIWPAFLALGLHVSQNLINPLVLLEGSSHISHLNSLPISITPAALAASRLEAFSSAALQSRLQYFCAPEFGVNIAAHAAQATSLKPPLLVRARTTAPAHCSQ